MATYTAGELVWKITGDKSGLDKSLDQTDKRLEKTGGSFKSFASVASKALVAVGLTQFVKDSIKAASDAEEVANKFGVVFSKVFDDANKAAENLRTNYGLSGTAARQYLSDTQDLLTGLGVSQEESLALSESVAQLGIDLASFTNIEGGAERATMALRSAMLGEREAVKALGISIQEADLEKFAADQGKVWKEMSKGEKAALTLELAMSQSTNAIGDFARSSDSFANRIRVLQSRFDDLVTGIGGGFLPIASQIVKEITDIVELILELSDGTKDAADGMGFLEFSSKAVIAAVQVLGKVVEVQIRNIANFTDAAANMGRVAKAALDVIRAEGTVERYGAIEAFKVALEESDAAAEKFKNDAVQGFSDIGDEIRKSVDDIFATSDAFEEAGKKQSQALQAVQTELKKTNEKSKELQKTWDDLTGVEQWQAVTGSISQINGLLGAGANLVNAQTSARVAQLDIEEQRALEAAGVAEAARADQLQAEIANFEMMGDTKAAQEKKVELKRLKIQEDFAKKKAELEYRGNLQAWNYSVAQASIQAAAAPLNAYVAALTIPPPFGPIIAVANAGLAAATAAVQLAAVKESKPQPPKFAQGGIVPGNQTTGDNVTARLNSGEMVLNQQQQARLFEIANNGGGGQGNIKVYIGDNLIYDNLYRASQNGELLIDTRAVVTR